MPQAMRLIQSLSQMISQTSSKKVSAQNYDGRNKIRIIEKPKKKNTLQTVKNYVSYLLPKSKLDNQASSGETAELENDENTLKMIIQNKKRSSVDGSLKKVQKRGGKKDKKGGKSKKGKTTKAHPRFNFITTPVTQTKTPSPYTTILITKGTATAAQKQLSTIAPVLGNFTPSLQSVTTSITGKIFTTEDSEESGSTTLLTTETTPTVGPTTQPPIVEPETEESGGTAFLTRFVFDVLPDPKTAVQ